MKVNIKEEYDSTNSCDRQSIKMDGCDAMQKPCRPHLTEADELVSPLGCLGPCRKSGTEGGCISSEYADSAVCSTSFFR